MDFQWSTLGNWHSNCIHVGEQRVAHIWIPFKSTSSVGWMNVPVLSCSALPHNSIWNYPRPDPLQSDGCRSSPWRWQGMGCYGLDVRVQGGAADSVQREKRWLWGEEYSNRSEQCVCPGAQGLIHPGRRGECRMDGLQWEAEVWAWWIPWIPGSWSQWQIKELLKRDIGLPPNTRVCVCL